MALSTSGGHGSHSAWFLSCLYLGFLLDTSKLSEYLGFLLDTSKLSEKRTKKNNHMLILNLSTFFFFFKASDSTVRTVKTSLEPLLGA